ncbi:hypothetical protein BCV70DRAFT_198836 [Testicularia cyperi]|uniref:RRM domain-containing protein n=1 Tax=Testicularia cyperi TaxID=1882483 RepID=A0A317XT33_9BASI|nr:hypothetical protein BCV70DRAFT_198836 [Testicularia cyperi]
MASLSVSYGLPRVPHPAAPTASGSSDPRVYLDKLSGRWRYEDEEGDEWEWQDFVTRSRPAIDQGEQDDDDDTSSSLGSASRHSSATRPRGHWVKVLDDDLVRAQQQAYSVQGVDESLPADSVLRRSKKRKSDQDLDSYSSNPSSGPGAASSSTKAASGGASKPGPKPAKLPPSKRPKPITSLYVSGLPLDCTSDEIAAAFSRYGLLLEDDAGNPRIKMYHDDKTGLFRGEALVVYFKPESVDLAINMLDQTSLRAAIGQVSASGPTMRVQRAEFPNSTNPSRDNGTHTATAQNSKGLDSNSSLQPRQSSSSDGVNNSAASLPSHGQRRNLTDQERKKIQKRVARMENKLTDWRDSDSEDEAARRASHVAGRSDASLLPSSVPTTEGSKTVVLTKMFTLAELEDDPTLLLDLKSDVREECTSSFGPVTNVTLWDLEPEGIITVRFSDPAHALQCTHKMDGRFFATRRISAFLLPGKPRFRKSTTSHNHNQDDLDSDIHDNNNDLNPSSQPTSESQRRKDQFGAWLEQTHTD